jgi:hypothetical protein
MGHRMAFSFKPMVLKSQRGRKMQIRHLTRQESPSESNSYALSYHLCDKC